NLCDTLKDSIGEVVRKARDPNHLYAGVVRLAKEHLKRYKESRRRSTHDDALLELYAALKDPETLEKIRGCFRAVLIDEFQDTDVLQWDLFKTLFYDDPQMRATLTLVGDPKQSIYAFREGDVYTYLNAVETLGKENAATLNTNWRSQKGLVECLNALFDSKAFPSLLELPRLNKSLEVPPVCSGRKESASVDDEKGAVHFLEVEHEKEVEELLLDKISSEILRLEGDQGVPFSSWAILVSDKNQSQKAVSRLKSYGIPVIAQKKGKLHETEGYSSVLQLLTLLSEPVSLGALKAFLGARMIGWSASEIFALQDEDRLFEVSKTVAALRNIALKSGFGRCFEEFLLSDFGSRRPVDLLQREPLLLAEMRQVVDLLMGEEREKMLSLGALKNRLEDLERVSSFAEDEMQVRQIAGQNAVQVLTIHTSKGLEFDYVFPLGLVTGRKPVDKLIPAALKGKRVWTWNGFNEDESEKHAQELEAEKLRLLYVAFTRAKERLYVPWVISEKPKDCSAIKLYSARYQGKEDFRSYALSAGCSWERVSESKEASLTPPLDLLEERLCLKAPLIARSEIALDSFTSLTKDLARIHQSDCPQDALPAGRLTGIVIHKLMEKLDFHAPTEEHLDQLMRQYVAKSPLEGFEEQLKGMLKSTSHVPLKAATETFTLGSLSSSHLLREPEFLYNEEHSHFIRGAIDCICFTGQKYYL
ncbi:MAG: UvrD-helicase domain-containing protein, partial [Chlamydiia bacterium]|nr:UvrD-helicase domain-containing protein [Chlamydiia bacterium]